MVEFKLEGYKIKLFFDKIPPKNIRETMKICGWWWNAKNKCWVNKRSEENIEFAKALQDELNPKPQNPILDYERAKISYEDILIKSNSFYCNKHHKVKDMAGEIDICNKKGDIYTWLVPIAYCDDCKLHYMLEDTFKEISKRGVLMCQIMSYERYKSYSQHNFSSGEWSDMSPLKIMGYSVSEEDNLSEKQRQVVLERMIDNKVMTKDRVLSYLDFFVRLRNDDSKACGKWKKDRDYISQYDINSKPRIRIGEIRIFEL